MDIWVNGMPLNSFGIGYDNGGGSPNIDMVVNDAIAQQINGNNIGFNLPVALQPSHFPASTRFSEVDKTEIITFDGDGDSIPDGNDFDEGYDAPDFNNWYLSYRHLNGAVIPSFHRPAIINYILNERSDWTGASEDDFANAMASIARATMRPLPIAENQFGINEPLNEKFTGGNPNFALRIPIDVNNAARLDQIAKVLTGFVDNAYDVDNDLDGTNDSVWIDLGLPVFTAPDGKLVKPLIAPMIEDLSARLNVNAHGSYALVNARYGLQNTSDRWAGRPATSFVFRGLGYGPAEINIDRVFGPAPPAIDPGADHLAQLLDARYAEYDPTLVGVPGAPKVANQPNPDELSVVADGRRPPFLNGTTSDLFSIDPYGRGGVGISGSGNLVSINSGQPLTNVAGTNFVEPDTNEASDNPYEFDPSGRLNGDRAFTPADLETAMRANEFGNEVLAGRLRELLEPFVQNDPDFMRKVTTTSVSDQSPRVIVPDIDSVYMALRSLIDPGRTLPEDQLERLIAPELRLGNRLNVNRAIGNGIDDSTGGSLGFGVVDEPLELLTEEGNQAFVSAEDASEDPANPDASVPTTFRGITPDYDFDEPVASDPRQLLARHLYVLMMMLSDNLATAYPTFGDTLTPVTPVSDRAAYRARRMAQWAVNVVDYRDSDSIMTAFEYDQDISDGWDVDGDLSTTAEPTRAVVFGAENPDLLLTESMALHDVRVRDTDMDSSGQPKGTSPGDDDDTDQVRVPQGSLFLELYCPREQVRAGDTYAALSGFPAELYDVTSGTPQNYYLDLDKTVPAANNASVNIPVWRIAISEPHFQSPTAENSPLFLREPSPTGLPDTLSFEPSQLDELGNSAASLSIDRVVFFSDFSLSDLNNTVAEIPDINDQAEVYFNQSGVSAEIMPEQYLSLVPRATTYIGSEIFTTDPVKPSDQRLVLEADGLIHYDFNDVRITPDSTNQIKPGSSLVISGFSSVAWPGNNTGVGMNVSEPLANASDYYQEPTENYSATAGVYPIDDAYVTISGGMPADTAFRPLDEPEDIRVQGPIYELTASYIDPMVNDPMLGSFENYRTAFLQRLADPTQPYNPLTNPYRTVDQVPIDLTIFSGEADPTDITKQGAPGSIPGDEIDYLPGSRQKDGQQVDAAGIVTASHVLHSYSSDVPDPIADAPNGTDYFVLSGGTGEFDTTFNYLNTAFGPIAPFDAAFPELRGRPTTPFAMHPWLNRPFASPYELMMVPACSQGRLLEEFSAVPTTNPDPAVYPAEISDTTDVTFVQNFQGPYRHLLNFFHSHEVKQTGVLTSQFGLLFDLIATPARFRGEREPINPSRLTAAALTELYSPPFNLLDNNQRVGRININTLAEFEVYKGLMQGHANLMELTVPAGAANQDQLAFNSFFNSRRGYVPVGGGESAVTGAGPYNYRPDLFDPRYPTQFAGLFESSFSAPMGPILRDLANTTENDSENLRRRFSNSNLLRGLGTLAVLDPPDGSEPVQSGGDPVTPMFVRSNSQLPNMPYQDRLRNPYLRYQTLMRMPNLVSDNSQVFVIRLTMGFFEVDAGNVNNLGAEYNADIGKNERKRAMFIVDRSIPVGFIPGRDTNARDIVLYESYAQ